MDIYKLRIWRSFDENDFRSSSFLFQSRTKGVWILIHVARSCVSNVLCNRTNTYKKYFYIYGKIEKEKRASEKRFLSVLIQAEDNERRRLAKDLHDGIGPLLSTIKMSLSALKKLNTDEQQKVILDNLDTVVVESMKSVKEISNNLNPHVLDNFGR